MDYHEVVTNSAEETAEVGERLAVNIKGGKIIALTGELGAGKTTFVQGFARGLGVPERIVSPTFIIMRSYPTATHQRFYHVDLYRLEENIEKEVENIGLVDLLNNAESVIIIEWAERVMKLLPKDTMHITIESLGDTQRKIRYE
ncbi:tRNA (adenosine(37)-N6)-threonylcarbamoyltransferase complex ATPase subunit type 1 TsaE [Candidatus Woesebacteria bacterium RIFCSPHIGHO2_01_FULL_41_10]|uniref:tRNA threonylcarbamoyladenosine biosynthesis protein TsaE n=1 Tax=Candidatus Woesebacteria bacterium RIFCSPHIGHO2_01_FULL_41_10 TaxID=1802500 RepID=A0A1F7YPG2_9BACT|nr:MAG: tRNA (adenosine(37)-N6)-threonylcarbamoyltransferase complex ATPase subunit type 1 TsaE [Candidatus Woesebacteria bacterium RIFCSPHIGHO2_01_FULL_41_10]